MSSSRAKIKNKTTFAGGVQGGLRAAGVYGIWAVALWVSTAGASQGQVGLSGNQESETSAQAGAAQPSPAGDLEELEQRLERQAAEEERFRKEAADRTQEIKALRYRLIETANSIQDSEREIARIERELVRLTDEEAEASTQLQQEQANLSEVLAALQAFELSQPPALLVSPDDANRAARAALLLSDAVPALAEKAQTLRGLVEKLSIARAGLADQRAAYEKTASALVARRQILSELLSQKEQERDVAERLAAAAQKETAALASRATSLKGVVSRLQRLAHAVTPRLKPPRKGAPTPVPVDGGDVVEEVANGIEIIDGSAIETTIARATTTGRGSIQPVTSPTIFRPARSFTAARGALRPPVVGRVVGRFGQRDENGDRLDGLRLEVRNQAIVTSPYEARVVFAQSWGPIGNMIVLDVGGGYHVLLIGVGTFLVDAGQVVNAGEPLAEMTVAGAASDLQTLDMQIRKNGEPVNPASWLSPKTVEEMAF